MTPEQAIELYACDNVCDHCSYDGYGCDTCDKKKHSKFKERITSEN